MCPTKANEKGENVCHIALSQSCKESRTFYLLISSGYPFPLHHYHNLADDLRSPKVHSREDRERNPAPKSNHDQKVQRL